MLQLCGHCVTALTESYQMIFAADYARGRFGYARIRPRIYRSACRMLELIKLQHRIVGLRYMPLPSTTTRIANTVFAAMRACEPVEFPIEALSAGSQAIDVRGMASLRQHYASLLTYPILDYSAWPEQEQFFIDTYCNAIQDAIQFNDYDPKATRQPKDQFIVGCYQDSPPARKLPQQADLGPTLVIDYSILGLSIRKDYTELSRARIDRNHFAMPPRLARLEPVYQTATGYLLPATPQPSAPAQMGRHRQRPATA